MNVPVLSATDHSEGTMPVPQIILDRGKSYGSVYYAINAELSNRRMGSAATKGRSAVKGSGIKPWRQKGSGRARAGSRQSPIWRGGGVVFGPQPRMYRVNVPRKQRAVALCSVLCKRIRDKKVYIIDGFKLNEVKTKLMHQQLSVYLHMAGRADTGYHTVLVTLDDGIDNIEKIYRAGRNIPYLTMQNYQRMAVHTLFYSEYIFLYQNVFNKLVCFLENVFSDRERVA